MEISKLLLKGILASVAGVTSVSVLSASSTLDMSSNALSSGVLDSSQNLLLDSSSADMTSFINFGIDPNSGTNSTIQNDTPNDTTTSQSAESNALDSATTSQNPNQNPNTQANSNQPNSTQATTAITSQPTTTQSATSMDSSSSPAGSSTQSTATFSMQPTQAPISARAMQSERFLSTNGGFNPDNKSISTLNSFGVSEEFLASLKTNTILHSQSDDKRWARFVQQFDSSYEFIPIIRSMIAQGGIPQEFLFLAMAESGFSSKAYSRKKASGIWQFMSFTARDMGLIINDYVDERRDPIKSTKAAIRYLQYLYQATGEWYLAAMAYNCGLGRLNRAIAKAGTKDLNVLLDERAKYLPAETRNYIRTILSMSLAFGNLQKMRDTDREYLLNRGAMDTLAEVQVKGGTMLESIAAGAGMDIDDIKKYNRHIIYHFLPPNQQEYSVYIPYDRLAYFKQNFDQDNAKIAEFMFHRVKKGENLASIAKRYGITVATLKSTNNLSEKPRIVANQKLLVPLASSGKIAQK